MALPLSRGVPALETLEARLLLSATLADGSMGGTSASLTYDSGTRRYWLDLDVGDGLDSGAGSKVDILSHGADGLVADLHVPGFWLDITERAGEEFTKLSLPEGGVTGQVGQAQLPVLRETFVVPRGVEVTASVSGQGRGFVLTELGAGRKILPAQEPILKSQDPARAAFALDAAYYNAAEMLGGEVVVSELGTLAGQRLVSVEVPTVHYLPLRGEVTVFSDLVLELGFVGPAKGGTSTTDVTDWQGRMLDELAVNYDPPVDKGGAGRLLVVSHDSLAEGLTDYIAHKQALGWTVDLETTATAGATNSAIRDHIVSRYDSTTTRPSAVLLVGDTNLVPHFIGSGSDSPPTDLYYGCMDGEGDYLQELPVGRFSVRTLEQLATVTSKTIAYETSDGGAWAFQAALMAGDDNYHITEATHEYIITNYLEPAGYTSDRLYEVSHDAVSQDVIDAFNAGRALGVYSGHGIEDRWVDGPQLTYQDVHALTNAGEFSFVLSFACLTGQYTWNESFMETWLRAENGAVAAMGSSVNSYWFEDDLLEKVLFEAIFEDSWYAFGQAIMQAKQQYLAQMGEGARTLRYFEMYNLMGDPTVELIADLQVVSDPLLPGAQVGEEYELYLAASGGTSPYTWELEEGQLPDGMTLSPDGRIYGTAGSVETVDFTVRVTDAADQSAVRRLTLAIVEPLEIITPVELAHAGLGVSYSAELRAQGGTLPYNWAMEGVGEYEERSAEGGFVGAGSAMGWKRDDGAWSLDLPWAFPFFDQTYHSLSVASNGFVDFATDDTDYSNTAAELMQNVRIAPLWDDLRTDVGEDDIYITTTDEMLTIRWDARLWQSSAPVDVELALHRDGTIGFHYGGDMAGLTPTIGVSAGDGQRYLLASLDGMSSLQAGQGLELDHGGMLPPGLELNTQTGRIEGTPTEQGVYEFNVVVTDGGLTPQSDIRRFSLSVSEYIDDQPPRVTGHVPFDGVNGPQSSVVLTFSEAMDPASFDLAKDVQAFVGPGGVDLLDQITGHHWLDARTLEVSFHEQSGGGAYQLVIGPDITDPAPWSNLMDQDGDGLAGEAGQDAYSAEFDILNRAPTVNILAPRSDAVCLPTSTTMLVLEAEAYDDGVGSGELTTSWSVLAKPAGSSVVFEDGQAKDTVAAFTTKGSYVLQFLASDGERVSLDEITVDVGDQGASPMPDLLWWELDEGGGNLAGDSSLNGHAGAISQASWHTGQSGWGLEMDATGQVVDSQGGPLLDGLTGLTVTGWIRPDAAAGSDMGWLAVTDGQEVALELRYVTAGLGGADNVIQARLNTTAGPIVVESAGGVHSADWQFVALRWASGEGVSLHVDSSLPSQLTYDTGPTGGQLETVGSMILGQGADGAGWTGRVDDFRIYGRGLGNQEILAVWENRPTNTAPWPEAGTDRAIHATSGKLDGGAIDDSLPNPPSALTYSWQVLGGPGSVSFLDAGDPQSTIEVSSQGMYRLRLIAGDGQVETADDVTLVFANPADANIDGVVDIGDLGIMAYNFGRVDASWNEGDFTFDGRVDVSDLAVLAANWRT